MKVGIIHGDFETLGGSEKVLISIIKLLRKNGYPINLYFSKKTPQKKLEKTFGKLLTDVNIEKIFQITTRRFGLFFDLLNRFFLTRAANKDDIVIETTGALSPYWFTKKPYYVYCNGFNFFINYSNQNIIKKIYLIGFKKLDEHFRKKIQTVKIISNSNYTKHLIQNSLGVDSHVIYPPVNLEEFNKYNTKKRGIISICRYSPEKNIEFLIQVLGKINVKPKIIFGSLESDNLHYFNKLKNLAQNQNIELITNQSRSELKKYLENSKIYFHAAQESFGISVVEAISAGCIPVVPDNSAHLETVPYSELRYKKECASEANQKLEDALDDKFDYLVPKLLEHIKRFQEITFEKEILKLLKF